MYGLSLASSSLTTSSNVTGNIEFLPLDNKIWVDKIVSFSESNAARRDMQQRIVDAGYDIRWQVKVLEAAYSK